MQRETLIWASTVGEIKQTKRKKNCPLAANQIAWQYDLVSVVPLPSRSTSMEILLPPQLNLWIAHFNPLHTHNLFGCCYLNVCTICILKLSTQKGQRRLRAAQADALF